MPTATTYYSTTFTPHHTIEDSAGTDAVGVLVRTALSIDSAVQVDGLACDRVSSANDRGSCLEFEGWDFDPVSVTVTNATMQHCQGPCIHADVAGDYNSRVIVAV